MRSVCGTITPSPASVQTLPTDILRAEHRVVEQVLGCLAAMADTAERARTVDGPDAADAVLFLRTFLDACHHGKEEGALFPAMERHGFPAHAGPTEVMRLEHQQGRVGVAAIEAAAKAWSPANGESALSFARAVRGFVGLLTEHIAKEEEVLFPMAESVLPPAVQSEVLAAFHRAETDHMGQGTHERFLAVADRLGAKYGVKRTAAAAGTSGGCGCSH